LALNPSLFKNGLKCSKGLGADRLYMHSQSPFTTKNYTNIFSII